MNYIWNNYSEENKFVISKCGLQSGKEVLDVSSDAVSVNVLGRLFDLVFPGKYIGSEDKYVQLIEQYLTSPEYKEIFNLLIHFQASFDRNCGFSVQDIVAMNIEEQINDGVFGEEIYNLYSECDLDRRCILLDFYARELISGGKNELFEECIAAIFGQVNIYFQRSTCCSYIYIHREKNEKDLRTVRLAMLLLCRLGRNVKIMWKGEHIPIIGTEYSMIIGNMSIG